MYEASKKKFAEFLKQFDKRPTFYQFEYEDGDGDYFAALEHGNLFERMAHLCVSHH